jgi:hypothetical protein
MSYLQADFHERDPMQTGTAMCHLALLSMLQREPEGLFGESGAVVELDQALECHARNTRDSMPAAAALRIAAAQSVQGHP